MTAFPAHSLIKLPGSVCQPACFLILPDHVVQAGIEPVWSHACTPHLSLGSEQEQSQTGWPPFLTVACIFKGSK